MIENSTKQKLLDGQTVVGCFVRSPDAGLVEYVANGGWDFMVLDGEHGLVSPSDTGNLARACEVRGVTPIVRVGSPDRGAILRCLDGGAGGILFPWINTKEEAEAAVSAAKYWPQGVRGLAGNRSTDWRIDQSATERANEETLVIGQIETRESVANVDELCSVAGVDVLFIGPADLSQSLGVPGDLGHAVVIESIERVATAVRASDKSLGMFAATPEAAQLALGVGARFIATGVEALLNSPMHSYVGQVRGQS